MKIRLANAEDAIAISGIVIPLAEKFIAHEFSELGHRTLIDSMSPVAIRNYIDEGYRFHVAEAAGSVNGVVATRDNSHLYHLFVAESCQGRGLARELWHVTMQACLAAGNPGEFTVKSSRYATCFYEKMGFIRVGDDVKDDVHAILMQLRLQPG